MFRISELLRALTAHGLFSIAAHSPVWNHLKKLAATPAQKIDPAKLPGSYVDFDAVEGAFATKNGMIGHPLGMGKYEPEHIGGILLRISSKAGEESKEWMGVPWPTLSAVYARSLTTQLAGFCLDGSPFALFGYLKAMPHVPQMPPDDGATFIGQLGSMIEMSRTDGQPNFLVIGTRMLIEKEFAELIPGKGDKPDMLAPTQKLVDMLNRSIKKAA